MRNIRAWVPLAALVWVTAWAAGAGAQILVAPQVCAVGVEHGTAAAFELLLVHELERHPEVHLLAAISASSREVPCADTACAARRAVGAGADAALLCTLTRLGRKLVVTLQRVEPSGRVAWSERQSAARADDLDAIAVRLGEIVAARSSAGSPVRVPASAGWRGDAAARGQRAAWVGTEDPAPKQSADRRASRGGRELESPEPQDEARPGRDPKNLGQRRHGWSSKGPRVGALYPLAHSYAGVPRLTTLAYVWSYQTPAFNVETVPLLGVAWGGDLSRDRGTARAWSLLDLYLGWTPLRGDVAPYAGAGLGLQAVRLERDATGGPFLGRRGQSAMSISMGLGLGLALFRTYDFQIGVDLRYHRLMNAFSEVGGDGAQGLALTFGLQHL